MYRRRVRQKCLQASRDFTSSLQLSRGPALDQPESRARTASLTFLPSAVLPASLAISSQPVSELAAWVAAHELVIIATPMAGADRGMYFLPEVNDEVLVMFEFPQAEEARAGSEASEEDFRCRRVRLREVWRQA